MSTSVSAVRVINETPLQKDSVISRGQKISIADICLNGHKIRISGSFRDLARQINRFKARTGVTAEIHVTKGKERLVLKTNKPKVSIVDKAGALAAYFNANKMGVGSDKLIESGLGETYLRKIPENLGQEIADAIYAKKSFSLYSKYSLSQTKIDDAIYSAIETAKLKEYEKFAANIIESFKRSGYTVSSSNTKRIQSAITNGLTGLQNITFEDFYFDSKRIRMWTLSEILNKAENKDNLRSGEVGLTTNNAGVLECNISKLTKSVYQVA